MSDDFGDITPDDAYSDGDEDINWDHVDLVKHQMDGINAIEDDGERLEAAKEWARELAGEG